MDAPLASAPGPSLLMVEGGLTVIAAAVAFCWPGVASMVWAPMERAFGKVARRKILSVVLVATAVLVLRLAILPLFPVPRPFVPNDFSFLLAANTFASGRLTNPAPPMWPHFESIHIDMNPTYMSMYFPGQGLVLALGKVLFGQPWYGVLLTSALMCGALCWALQAWLPPAWALLGGLVAVLRLGLFSYWINTIFGAGFVPGLGGALVLGALPRFMRKLRNRDGLLLAAGMVVLLISRPYETLLLCIPVAVILGRWTISGKNRPSRKLLLRRAAAPVALLLAGAVWLAYYNDRVFGSPFTLPYKINRATYAMAPYYVWQSARPEPAYRHAEMREFYYRDELDLFKKIQSLSGFVTQSIAKAVRGILFFSGIALLPPLIMARRVLLDRRMRFMVLCLLVLTAGMLIEVFLIPHYLAAFTVVFYVLGLQAMRHLRLWAPGGRPVGMALLHMTLAVCVVMGGVRVFAAPLQIHVPEWPPNKWTDVWFGPDCYGAERAGVEAKLEQLPGKQLVLVRYSSEHNPMDQWVYNAPDIGRAKVVWAWEMDPASDKELINYYKDRKAWLVEPDRHPVTIFPYSLPEQGIAALR